MSERSVRKPAVAGSFYPDNPEEITKKLLSYIGDNPKNKNVIGAIAPHAGWLYSGHVAGAIFASIKIPDTVILFGPNHKGLGVETALDSSTAWSFPFSDIEVDRNLSTKIADSLPSAKFDATAHANEHSLEVIVPFLFYRNRSVRIVPISLSNYDDALLAQLGKSVAEIIRGKDVLIVASSDLSHFESDDRARSIDTETIKCIEKMVPEAVLKRAKNERALCGGGPVHALLTAGRVLGATEAKLVKYATSGDISGDRDRVVGYAGFIVR